jgi:membrane associated rhomboid family serine protease
MIPIRDTIRSRRFPVVNTILIILNVVVFLLEYWVDPRVLDRIIGSYGLVPQGFWTGGPQRWITLYTSMFLHGSWFHVISNMLALYIFGDNVEDRLGHVRYLIFYMLGGTAAGLAHMWLYANTELPTVGASGAIAAVLGGYLLLFPRSRVITLVPVLFFFRAFAIPAPIYLVLWFVMQLFNGALSLAVSTFQGGGVAWWAHIGGFIIGLALVKLFEPRRRRREYPDEYYAW